MTKRTERKPRAKSHREMGTGRQFKVGHVYPIELCERRTVRGGPHLHIEQKRIFKGSFELHKSVREHTGTLCLYGQIIENGEDFVIVLGKGVPR